MPCQILVNGRLCKIPTKDSMCHIHSKSSKLMKKIVDQKIELATLNKRLSDAMRKLHIIDECDRVKFELLSISKNCSFRAAINNVNNKDVVERIFNAPYEECIDIYNNLLDTRNALTHKYTSKVWVPKKRVCYNRTLKELCLSISIK